MVKRDGLLLDLKSVDAILAGGGFREIPLGARARADLCQRLGQTQGARASYERTLGLTRQEPERRFLERRLSELPK